MSGLIQCPDCRGEGKIPLGEHFVTHDMAFDACEPSMEGQSMGIEYSRCPRCQGDGFIFDDEVKP